MPPGLDLAFPPADRGGPVVAGTPPWHSSSSVVFVQPSARQIRRLGARPAPPSDRRRVVAAAAPVQPLSWEGEQLPVAAAAPACCLSRPRAVPSVHSRRRGSPAPSRRRGPLFAARCGGLSAARPPARSVRPHLLVPAAPHVARERLLFPAGRPYITGGTRSAGAALSLQPSRPQVTARLHTGSDLFFAPACVVRLLCMAGLICSLLLILSRGCACLLLSIIFIIALLVAGHPLSLLLISCCCWCPSTAIHILLVPAAVICCCLESFFFSIFSPHV